MLMKNPRPDFPPENINGHTKKLSYILDQLQAHSAGKSAMTVLDFGCGNGASVSQYLISGLPAARYVGVDVHGPSLDHAQRNFGREGVEFAPAVPDRVYDAIVYADVLEHLDNPAELLGEHVKMLRAGGIVIGSIPNGWGPFEIESSIDRALRISQSIAKVNRGLRRMLGRAVQPSLPYNIESGHLQFYRRRPFTEMLRNAGLTMVDFRNGAFIGAMVSERVLRYGGQPFMRANTKVADFLPSWAVSTWLFTAQRSESHAHGPRSDTSS